MSNESLLTLISDAQMSTECYRNVTTTKEKIIEDLKGTIEELIKLYNRANGGSLILADYTKIANEIKAIDKWAGQAFQKDDEVDIALQDIASLIDFPRNGSVKAILAPTPQDKKEYHLFCYNNGSYKNAKEAIASGGNWEIESFLLDDLNVTILNDSDHSHIVRDSLDIANNAMNVFGHLEDAVYFITDTTDVIFHQDDSNNCIWVETDPAPEPTEDKVEQVTIPITIFVTATGTNIRVKEEEIRASLTAVFEHSIKYDDGSQFETEFADLDFAVVETKVLCTEPITYTDI